MFHLKIYLGNVKLKIKNFILCNKTICINLVHNFLVFTLKKRVKKKVYKFLSPFYTKLQLKPAIT